MTPQSVIALVRGIIKDDDSVSYRNSDETIRLAVIRALHRIALTRPDLFTTLASVPTTAGSVIQEVPNRGRVVEVFSIENGGAVLEVTRETMDQLVPDWQTHAAGPCVNWMRHNRDPSRFFVYPKAPPLQNLLAQYTTSPSNYALTDAIPLAEMYLPAVVDVTVAEIEWADDEHELSERANSFFERAMKMLAMNNQTEKETDLEESGGDPKVVS